jgi:hypothetical protein
MADPVRVEGLNDLRRGLRQIDRGALKEVQQTSKKGAQVVAAEAGRLAPKGTRPLPKGRRQRLHQGYRGTTSGNKGIVRNPLPHAVIYEYRKTGTPAQMRGVRPVERALERKQDAVLAELARGIDGVIRRGGFR